MEKIFSKGNLIKFSTFLCTLCVIRIVHQEFINDVAKTFEKCQLAYIVDKEQPVTIYPATMETEGKTFLEARKQLLENSFLGAEVHLRKAADFLHQGEYADSIRESMHVVESVARKLAPDSPNSLDKALKVLQEENPLHPALKKRIAISLRVYIR